MAMSFIKFDEFRYDCGFYQGNIQRYKLLNVIRYFKDHCTKGMSKEIFFYKVEVIDEP